MRVSLILGHPKIGSFNHAIAATAQQALAAAGWQCTFHDLYAEGFDPLLPPEELARGAVLPPEIQRHCDEIVAADAIVIVHPNWWGQPPAILRGWQDRVLRMGIAYRFGTNEKGEPGVIGLLKARWALVFTTSNTPREQEVALYGDPLDNLWKRCVLQFCGVRKVVRHNFESVIMSSPPQRKQWLADVGRAIRAEVC